MISSISIALTQGFAALIDAEDFEKVTAAAPAWQATKMGVGLVYAVTRGPRREGHKPLAMHRVIMDAPRGLLVDHINHDTLDNRKANLRVVTRQQNQCNVLPREGNSSRFKGVCFNKRAGLWFAYINAHGQRTYLGYFKDEVDAAKAYDSASITLHGEFGFRNLALG